MQQYQGFYPFYPMHYSSLTKLGPQFNSIAESLVLDVLFLQLLMQLQAPSKAKDGDQVSYRGLLNLVKRKKRLLS